MRNFRDMDRKNHIKKIECLINFLISEYRKLLKNEQKIRARMTYNGMEKVETEKDLDEYEQSELKDLFPQGAVYEPVVDHLFWD